MIYSFDTYQFDCDKKILACEGQVVSLNEKAANMLALFLLNKDKVIAKDEILEAVWTDRVVTEQVVFQNISQLRALFGNSAIKTFSKKGYQWQLPIVEVKPLAFSIEEKEKSIFDVSKNEIINETDKESQANVEQQAEQNERKTFPIVGAALSGIFVLFICIWLLITNNSDLTGVTKVNHEVFQLNVESRSRHLIEDISVQQLIDSPVSAWNKFSLVPTDLLVGTQLYVLEDAIALQFVVQGKQRQWQDHIVAESELKARQTLTTLLNLVADSDYFIIKSEFGALAELNVLNQELPNNTVLKRQLLKAHLAFEQLPQVNALLAEQLERANTALEKGILLLLKNEAARKAKDRKLAKQSITQAITLFEQIELSHMAARAYLSASRGYMVEQNFREGMAVLNTAATHARRANQAFLEVEANVVQAFFAAKVGEIELAHAQLDLANQLIKLHSLGEEHIAFVLYYSGRIEKEPHKRAAIYEQLINSTYASKYKIFFYGAADSLREHYILKQDFNKAKATIKDWQVRSFQMLTQALIEFSQQNIELGKELSEAAFHQAQLEQSRYTALDAALLLTKHNSNLKQAAKLYIEKQATPRWLEQNSVVQQYLNE